MLNLISSNIWRGSTLFLTGLLLAVSTVFLSGCFKEEDNLDELAKEREEAYFRQLATDTVAIKEHLATNNINNAKRTKSGLFYVEQTAGTGVQAKVGDFVSTHYRLTNLAGDVLDTSYGKSPFPFRLGTPRSPIYGYQEGVSLLKVGGKSTFYLPSGLAYGPDGSPPTITPNMILVFEIELLEAKQ